MNFDEIISLLLPVLIPIICLGFIIMFAYVSISFWQYQIEIARMEVEHLCNQTLLLGGSC